MRNLAYIREVLTGNAEDNPEGCKPCRDFLERGDRRRHCWTSLRKLIWLE
jgi:hypothetical protein